MGYKLLRDTYKIEHIVQVLDKKEYGGRVICIGSPYVHDLIVINMEGEIVKRNDGMNNNDLRRYMQEFDADPEKLKRIVQTTDAFDADKNKTVYIYDSYYCRIRTEVCQEYGYPNTTNTGELMYYNTSFKNYKDALNYALRDTEYNGYRHRNEIDRLQEAFERLWKAIRWIVKCRKDWVYVRTVLRFRYLIEK